MNPSSSTPVPYRRTSATRGTDLSLREHHTDLHGVVLVGRLVGATRGRARYRRRRESANRCPPCCSRPRQPHRKGSPWMHRRHTRGSARDDRQPGSSASRHRPMPTPAPFALLLEPSYLAPRIARRTLGRWLLESSCPADFVEEAKLVVDELVNNVVQHAATPAHLLASVGDGRFRQEVHDRSTAPLVSPHRAGSSAASACSSSPRWPTTGDGRASRAGSTCGRRCASPTPPRATERLGAATDDASADATSAGARLRHPGDEPIRDLGHDGGPSGIHVVWPRRALPSLAERCGMAEVPEVRWSARRGEGRR